MWLAGNSFRLFEWQLMPTFRNRLKVLVERSRPGIGLSELLAKRRILIAHIENENTLARDLNALMRQDDELSKQIAEERAIRAEAVGRGRMEVSLLDATSESFNPHTA